MGERQEKRDMLDSSVGQENSPRTQLNPGDKRRKIVREREYSLWFLLIENFKHKQNKQEYNKDIYSDHST